jgi:hypothetical protein
MCLRCEHKMAKLRSDPRRPPKRRAPEAKAAPPDQQDRAHHSAKTTSRLDTVRAQRVCGVIDHTVRIGLIPGLFPSAADGQHPPHGTDSPPQRTDSPRHRAAEALARQVSIYLGHVGCGLTYAEVGRLYGRDRSTAAHACSVIEDKRDDQRFDRLLELLECCVHLGFHQIEPGLAAGRLAQTRVVASQSRPQPDTQTRTDSHTESGPKSGPKAGPNSGPPGARP